MSSTTSAKSNHRPFMGTKLQPRQGIPAGIFAGLGMLILWLVGAELWGPGAQVLLSSIGRVLTPDASPTTAMVAGIIIHFAISIGLGALFASSLDKLDAKDTLIVSTFFGFTIWVVSVLILRHWVHVDAILMSRSWWGFLVFLFFGFFLSVYANRFGWTPTK